MILFLAIEPHRQKNGPPWFSRSISKHLLKYVNVRCFFAVETNTKKTCLPPISCPHGSWAPMARENALETTSG